MFLSAGKQVSGSTLAQSNSIAFFWRILTLPVKSFWMQHVSSFLSDDLSVSMTSYLLRIRQQLSQIIPMKTRTRAYKLRMR